MEPPSETQCEFDKVKSALTSIEKGPLTSFLYIWKIRFNGVVDIL